MKKFSGFPADFFTEILPGISNINELKVILYTFWYFSRLESKIKFISGKNFLEDSVFISGFSNDPKEQALLISEASQKAINDGVLLCANWEEPLLLRLFFINSKEGQAALTAYQKKYWSPDQVVDQTLDLSNERPNIFTLYEQNLGPLTPLIAEALRDAERNYPTEWIDEAIKAAVKNNVRRWNYVEAILVRWKEEGRNEKDRRDHQQDRKKYIEGEYGDLIKH
jgi:DNA replication protein